MNGPLDKNERQENKANTSEVPERVSSGQSPEGMSIVEKRKAQEADEKERVKEEQNEGMPDFFASNQNRLGFKGKLTLAIRRALSMLEREVQKESGSGTEAIRREFIALTARSITVQTHLPIPADIIMRDYRTYMIVRLAYVRRKRQGSF